MTNTNSATQEAVTTSVLVHLAVRRQTRKQLAEALGVDPSGVSKRLQGLRRWSLDDLDALAAWWEISPAQLLTPPAFATRNKRRGRGCQGVRPAPRRVSCERIAA